ncbi:hypothetical protein LEM8419_00409 [Neolewinella maritima]|uniref:DUF2064 domain-containing protein n=1 Tax=Neolewinella maritima TaxID=1383882 RepID=A0ABM9AWK7_9BACT|nr:DUF2064 domain-containing protein [Neolewinella maritima]CAH0999113.1 hypothetical protein LEM8419_00409 [Neolewinella maritima]
MTATTAILFFSRTATAEADAKAFGRRGTRVARALIQRTTRTLAATGLPVYRSDERQQTGSSTFGDKLSEAVRAVLARGHAHILVVSNDCPRLSGRSIRAAAAALEAGRNVIGPDARGGAWLIGVRAECFDPIAFAAVSWQTDRVAAQLLEQLLDCIQLRTLSDYNSLRELRADWQQIAGLLPALAALFSIPTLPRWRNLLHCSHASFPSRDLRGPPVAR